MADIFSLLIRALRSVFPTTPNGDRAYLALRFLLRHKRLPHTVHPMSWNDHMFRILTSADLRSEFRTRVSDKQLLKSHIAATVGERFVMETIALLTSERDIDAFKLPDRPVVFKPNNASGSVMFFDPDEGNVDRQKLKDWLSFDYYWRSREANYQHIKPCIIMEPLMLGPDGVPASDFKVFCFHGKPCFVQHSSDRFNNYHRAFYSLDWQLLPFRQDDAPSVFSDPPANLQDMLETASVISQDFDFVRVDFLSDGRDAKIVELTSCPKSVSTRFVPAHYDALLGRLFEQAEPDIMKLLRQHGVAPNARFNKICSADGNPLRQASMTPN